MDNHKASEIAEDTTHALSSKLTVLSLFCAGMQIAGLALSVVGVPIVASLGGFAAIVNFFLIWSSPRAPRWLVRLAGFAAVCGLATIIFEIVLVI